MKDKKLIWYYSQKTKKYKKITVFDFLKLMGAPVHEVSEDGFYCMRYILSGFCDMKKGKYFALRKSVIKEYI